MPNRQAGAAPETGDIPGSWARFLDIVTVFVFVSVCLSGSAKTGANRNIVTYCYDTPDVHLKGDLVSRMAFGPPGFGETPKEDDRERIYVLKLTAPINVVPVEAARPGRTASLDPVNDIREIQLFMDNNGIEALHRLIGRPVEVVGTLNESITPSQHTKVWLAARAVTPR